MPTAKRRVERIGHRGAPREFPENTLPAFARAIAVGADAVELDVHATADGVPIVHHDPDVRLRGGRATKPLASMTWEEVAGIELAPGVFVPSLEQVLALAGHKATVYVELKGRHVEASAIAVIRKSGTQCAVHGFDHAAVARAAEIAPDLRRGILFDAYPVDVARAMRNASALDVWPQWDLIDRALVERVHGEGGRVIAWTVNTAESAQRLVALGVDGLCGDDVRVFTDSILSS
jgi:glycerophosphoryl diester phosphodiesterase